MLGAQKLVKDISDNRRNQKDSRLEIRDYDDDWNKILSRKVDGRKYFAGGFVDWDNTPRNVNGLAYRGATPEKFGKYFEQLVDKVNEEYDDNYVFVNAWNEWAEGAFLEPDCKNEYGYLEAIQRAVEKDGAI